MKQKKKNKVGRPKQKIIKVNTTIRLYPDDKKRLIKKYGSIQSAIDFLISKN
jgi:hypothetical protein